MLSAAAAFGQAEYPLAVPAAPPEDAAIVVAEMQDRLVDAVITSQPVANVQTATRIMNALSEDTGRVEVNFLYQSALVTKALAVSMSASPEDAPGTNAELNRQLIQYWNNNRVIDVGTDPDSAAVTAMHFYLVGQTILRTGGPNDAASRQAASEIFDAYSAAHPLAGTPAADAFLTRSVTPIEYVGYANLILEHYNAPTADVPDDSDAPSATTLNFALTSRCEERCRDANGCDDFTPGVRKFVCYVYCGAKCFIDNIFSSSVTNTN